MENPLELTAAILAGGLGTRLRPAIADRPKVLAPVGGRPFVTHLLDQLSRTPVREVVLLAGYRAGQLRDALGDAHQGIRLRYSVEEIPLGTAGALRHALPLLQAPRSCSSTATRTATPILPRSRGIIASDPVPPALVLTHVPDTSRFGRARIGSGRPFLRFEEKGDGRAGLDQRRHLPV